MKYKIVIRSLLTDGLSELAHVSGRRDADACALKLAEYWVFNSTNKISVDLIDTENDKVLSSYAKTKD